MIGARHFLMEFEMKRITYFLFFWILGFGFAAQAEMAADSRAMYDRMDRLERDITLLQRKVYKAGALVAEQGNAVAVPADLKTGSVEHLYTKISELENVVAQMTAQMEELSHQLAQTQSDLNKINSDVDFRFSELKKPEVITPPTTQDSVAPVKKEDKPKDAQSAYEAAYKLLNAQKYAEAQVALEDFLKNYPADALAGNAQYWLGETFYVRELYEPAAVAFANGFKNYKTSTKGADNLLKLGLTMEKLDKKKEACTAFKSLKKEFPKASGVVSSRATKEMEKLGCNK